MTENECLTCGGSGEQMPECSCYEIIGGHQPGCCFHGMTTAQISEMAGKSWPCPDCQPPYDHDRETIQPGDYRYFGDGVDR